MKVTIINDNDFEEKVINSKGKVLVDFFAEWCGPCKMMGPIFEEVANEVDTCTFYKLNVDESPEISSRFGIMSIPTLMLFQDGEVAKVDVGAKSKEDLINFLND